MDTFHCISRRKYIPGEFISPESTRILNICNWEDYFGETPISDFEMGFQIKVNLEFYEDEKYLLSVLQSTSDRYDLVIASDGLIREMIKQRLLSSLNKKNILNLCNIEPEFKDRTFDPDNKYSIPYLWGTTGIAVNTKSVDVEKPSWNLLWDE